MTDAEFAAGLRCVPGDDDRQIGRCEIDRAVLDALLADPSLGLRGIRLGPEIDQYYRGYRIHKVSPGSYAERLGFEKFDLIVSINGYELNDAMKIKSELRDGGGVELDLERRGQAWHLSVKIVD